MLQFKARQVGRPIYFSPQEISERGTQLLDPSHILRAWGYYRWETEEEEPITLTLLVNSSTTTYQRRGSGEEVVSFAKRQFPEKSLRR